MNENCGSNADREAFKKDEVMPDGKWKFDEDVTAAFENMLERSIPQYEVMRKAVSDLGYNFVKPRRNVLDIGCSKGDAMAALIDRCQGRVMNAGYVGLEISEPMLIESTRRFKINQNVLIIKHDLRNGLPIALNPSLVMSVFTLQFVPMEHRQTLVQAIYDALGSGDAFILVEKVLGNDAVIDKMIADIYYDMKSNNGYTQEQILRKKLALEGVLVPVTAEFNIQMLKAAGFKRIDCFWRWMSFAGFIAIK